MNSFKNTLLASSVLTTVGFGASATTFIENSTPPVIPDFPNTSPGSDIDFSMFQSVQGTLQTGLDPADFFTFTGLTAGDNFSITFANTSPLGSSNETFNFIADALSGVNLAPGQSTTETGVLAATSLTVGVTDPRTIGVGIVAEGYTVALSESLPVPAPKPSAAAIFAVGLAGLAWRAATRAADRNRHR